MRYPPVDRIQVPHGRRNMEESWYLCYARVISPNLLSKTGWWYRVRELMVRGVVGYLPDSGFWTGRPFVVFTQGQRSLQSSENIEQWYCDSMLMCEKRFLRAIFLGSVDETARLERWSTIFCALPLTCGRCITEAATLKSSSNCPGFSLPLNITTIISDLCVHDNAQLFRKKRWWNRSLLRLRTTIVSRPSRCAYQNEGQSSNKEKLLCKWRDE